LLERVPRFLKLPFDDIDALLGPLHEYSLLVSEYLARALAGAIKQAVLSLSEQLRSTEMVLGEMHDEFDGEDILHPRLRETFAETLAQLAQLHDRIQEYAGEFDLPDAGPSLEPTRTLVEREVARH
jgi:hypothetical protein